MADEGKILRAMYGSGGGGEEDGKDEEEDEDTLGAEEEKEQEAHFREVALSKFIKAVGNMLQEHGDKLRHGRWQSLHDFTALLRALGWVTWNLIVFVLLVALGGVTCYVSRGK